MDNGDRPKPDGAMDFKDSGHRSPEVTWPPQRRAADTRIETLVSDMTDLKTQHGEIKRLLDENTKTTVEVRDILTTFKTLGAFAKWFSAIAAAVAGLWFTIKTGRG